jgi:hypothetical protein
MFKMEKWNAIVIHVIRIIHSWQTITGERQMAQGRRDPTFFYRGIL